tara:strand:+ start:12205 stop:13362 length:1158 start_codon:yes stop_codon:yes gene_type:complete
MRIIVYDLDDTLRDTSCAVDHIPEDRTEQENWIDWQNCVNSCGSVIDSVVDMYHRDLEDSPIIDNEVWIVTNSSFGTHNWLFNSNVPFPFVTVEREEGDKRHPVQYKKDWLIRNAYAVVKWVDDNQEVCDYVRNTYPHIEVVQVINVPGVGYETISNSVPSTPLSTKDEMIQRVIDRVGEKQLPLDEPNKVVIFNGPPRSGKDLATEFCCEYFNGTHASMKASLIKLTADTLGVTVEEFLHHYDTKCDDKTYKESGCVWVKDLPMYPLNGEFISKRDALIYVSEGIIKPTFGDEVFGKLAADSLPDGLVFFSDGGFPDELKPIADKVGIENMLIVHIKREGCTFEGDSRDYVNVDGVKTVVVENTTLGKYLADVAEVVSLHLKAH